MKRTLTLILITLFLPAILFAQDRINVTDKNGKKQGPWKKIENGKVLYAGQFKDDVPYGTFKYYHTNGKLKSETEFVQGVHKVHTVMYHENGHKASEGAYIDQQKDGEWRYYSERDTLIKVENYKLGKRNGLWQTYSQSGILLEECNYLNDKRDGLYKTYYLNGNVSLEENFVAGKINGKSTSYYPNKNISMTGNYHNSFRDGDWDAYDVNGKIRSTTVYKDHALSRTYIYLYQKGVAQKLNQDMVAYFVKNRDKVTVVLKNERTIVIDESMEEVEKWLDFMVFVRLNPRYIAAMDAIVSYKPVPDTDDGITVKIRPTPDEEIYVEGNDAKLLKAILATGIPEE